MDTSLVVLAEKLSCLRALIGTEEIKSVLLSEHLDPN